MRGFHGAVGQVAFGLAVLFGAAQWSLAAVLSQSSTSSTTQTGFDGNILNNDLIENGSADRFGSPVTTGNVSSYAGDVAPANNYDHLTDGLASSNLGSNDLSHDAYFDTFTPVPSIAYNLNIGAHPDGYTLTKIQSIYGWQNTPSFSHQKYSVSVAYVAAPTDFSTVVANVDYDPFPSPATGENSSQVTLSDITPSLLTGVAGIKFTFQANGGNGQVVREIDVTGRAHPRP